MNLRKGRKKGGVRRLIRAEEEKNVKKSKSREKEGKERLLNSAVMQEWGRKAPVAQGGRGPMSLCE